MPTTEQQLADAINAFDALAQEYADKAGLINDRLDAAEAAFANQVNSYYVDEVNGDDANDGLSAANAYQTVDRAVILTSDMQISKIYMMTDCTLNQRHTKAAAGLRFIGADAAGVAGTQRTLTVNPASTSNVEKTAGVWFNVFSMGVAFDRIDVALGNHTGTGTFQVFGSDQSIAIFFNKSTITHPGTGTAVLSNHAGFVGIWTTSTFAATGMDGYWAEGLAAGAGTNSLPWFLTDLAAQ